MANVNMYQCNTGYKFERNRPTIVCATFIGVQRELKSSLYLVGTPDVVRRVLIHALGL